MKLVIMEGGIEPRRSHLPDSGIDIFLPEDFTITSLETKTIGLRLKVAIPEGQAGLIIPRSSIAQKGLLIQTSIIDPDYTGEIHLIATNCSNNTLEFKQGDRLCSLCCFTVLRPFIEKVDVLPNTERGDNGLGSTGK